MRLAFNYDLHTEVKMIANDIGIENPHLTHQDLSSFYIH